MQRSSAAASWSPKRKSAKQSGVRSVRARSTGSSGARARAWAAVRPDSARRARLKYWRRSSGISPLEVTKCGGDSHLLMEYLFDGEDMPHA